MRRPRPAAPSDRSVKTLTVRTERQSQLVDVTRLVQDAVAGEPGSAVLVYVPHTTAGVTINEHADPMVARDFEAALERIVPADWPWQHVEEGEENAPTHIRASFMGPHVLVPLLRGRHPRAGHLAGDLLLRVRRSAHTVSARLRSRVSRPADMLRADALTENGVRHVVLSRPKQCRWCAVSSPGERPSHRGYRGRCARPCHLRDHVSTASRRAVDDGVRHRSAT